MRLRRPDPWLVLLVVAAVVLVLVAGPCSFDVRVADGEPAHQGPSPAEGPLFVAPPTTTTTSTTSTTVGRAHPVTAPARSLGAQDLGVFKVTCYGPPLFPAGQTTASGDPVGPGSIAVDPRVIPMGTRLFVEGYGEGVANDRGSAVNGRHVDVWRADPYNDCPIRSARVRVIG